MEEREEKGDGETGEWTSRDRAGSSANESGDDHWRLHRRPIYDGIEFLLLVEFLRRYVVENGESLARQMTEGRTADSGKERPNFDFEMHVAVRDPPVLNN